MLIVWRQIGDTDWQQESSEPFTGGTIVVALQNTAYYAFSCAQSSDGSTGNFQMVMEFETASGPLFGIQAVPDIWAQATDIEGIRCVGAALMLSPKTTILNVGGACVGRQCNKGVGWYSSMSTGDPYGKLCSEIGSERMDFQRGIYGFEKPRDVVDTEILTPFRFINGELSAIHNPEPMAWSCFAVTVTAGDSGTSYPGALADLSILYSVEYQTDSHWRDAEVSDATTQDLIRAIEILKTVKQFHENPLHIKEILGKIKSGLGIALRNAPQLLKVAQLFLPQLAIPANALRVAQGVGSML